jgi:hypothetical protein
MNFPITARCKPETYLRAVSYLAFMRAKFLYVIGAVVAILLSFQGVAQDCSQADANQLCADDAPPANELDSIPVNAGCIDVTSSYFYSFHTNSVADIYSANIAITPIDCDNPLGSDLIEVMVVEIPTGADPCDPSVYQNPVCAADIQEFTLQLNSLLPDQEYLIIVGSNHDNDYGPCTYEIDLSGEGVDLGCQCQSTFFYTWRVKSAQRRGRRSQYCRELE